MIIKLEKVISCTSEHPNYPATNLLQQRANSSWRCAKPGELLASVIFQLAEASTITGLDIGNYRSCIVVVTASTSDEPDNWIPVINHQFMTHDEAANSKFRDQVQLFSKKELSADTLKIKFSRVKVTCMQSANLREIFGLSFIVLRTEVVLQLGNDIFGRFKLKDSASPTLQDFKEKCLKKIPDKSPSYRETLALKIKEDGASNFAKRQEEPRELAKRPILDKIEEKVETEAKAAKNLDNVTRTPFGDVINSNSGEKENKKNSKRRSVAREDSSEEEKMTKASGGKCSLCSDKEPQDGVCKKCKKLPPQKPGTFKPPAKKPKIEEKPGKEFGRLFDDVSFALSGYVNPQRDEIRKKALKMGGKYVADPNTTNNRCTHLICAFKNTPKSQQLRGRAKLVTHKFVEDCYNKKTRFPWRRFALDTKDKAEPESEEEIEAGATNAKPPDPYEQETDPDSDY